MAYVNYLLSEYIILLRVIIKYQRVIKMVALRPEMLIHHITEIMK